MCLTHKHNAKNSLHLCLHKFEMPEHIIKCFKHPTENYNEL